jgi:hypothetical protein
MARTGRTRSLPFDGAVVDGTVFCGQPHTLFTSQATQNFEIVTIPYSLCGFKEEARAWALSWVWLWEHWLAEGGFAEARRSTMATMVAGWARQLGSVGMLRAPR